METKMKRKRIIALFLALACICVFTACSGKNNDSTQEKTDIGDKESTDIVTTAGEKETTSDVTENTEDKMTSDITEDTESEAATVTTEDAETEGASSQKVVYESPLGYSLTYDSELFSFVEADGVDSFICNALDIMVYIAVQKYTDMDAETVANGLVLQSGVDGLEITEAFLGTDNVEAKKVEIVTQTGGVKQIQTCYVIALKEGTLLVEVFTFEGIPESIDLKLQEMLDSFSLK